MHRIKIIANDRVDRDTLYDKAAGYKEGMCDMSEHYDRDNILCEYTICSWEDCRKLFQLLEHWVFRGQADSSWTLQTTLERGARINNCDAGKLPEIEKKIIREFQRRSYNYLDKVPDAENTLEWLSLMQHHGAPTRLLDFSYSYYIALYFSIEQALRESSVYCLNKELIYRKGLNKEKNQYDGQLYEYGTQEYCNYVLSQQTLSPLVMLIAPFHLHERLSRQQGLFAIPFEGRRSFEYNLALTVDQFRKELPQYRKLDGYENRMDRLQEECALLKVNIPREFHSEIRKELKWMNVTSETLFPDIDGFAKSLYGTFDL